VEVERGAGESIRELLPLDASGLSPGGTRWYEAYETHEDEWPALVVHHPGALETKVVARVSSTALARRLVAPLDATKNARTPLVPSARYWFRASL
jgi:hypothetical protein